MLQAQRADRAAPADLENLYVRSGRSGELVPLSNLVTLTEIAEPGSLNRFNRLRAITLSASLAPGYTLGEAIDWMEQTAAEELPDYAQIDCKGESREYRTAGGAVLFTFAMALLIVYLVLAAQFESFIHPLVIMLTVPLAVLGALIGLAVSGGTLNLFSQIGIVMLVGLAAKNGILIVEFANQLRDEGRTRHDAIVEAAAVRLRPILMTSIATMAGAVPLVARRRPGLGQPLDDRRRGDLRRRVLDPAVAVRRAGVLRAAGAVHALARRPCRSISRPSSGRRPR